MLVNVRRMARPVVHAVHRRPHEEFGVGPERVGGVGARGRADVLVDSRAEGCAQPRERARSERGKRSGRVTCARSFVRIALRLKKAIVGRHAAA